MYMREYMMYKINQMFDNYEYEEALNLLKGLEADGETDSWVLSNIGWVLGRLNRREEALEYLRTVEERGELDEDGWLSCEIGWNLGAMNKTKEAIYYLQTARKAGRDDDWINSVLGENLGKLERYEEGIYFLKRAAEKGRNDYWLNCEIGWQLEKKENSKKLWNILILLKRYRNQIKISGLILK